MIQSVILTITQTRWEIKDRRLKYRVMVSDYKACILPGKFVCVTKANTQKSGNIISKQKRKLFSHQTCFLIRVFVSCCTNIFVMENWL